MSQRFVYLHSQDAPDPSDVRKIDFVLKRWCLRICLQTIVCWAGLIANSTSTAVSQEQQLTRFEGSGQYGTLLDTLREQLLAKRRQKMLEGIQRTYYVPWVRDQVHVTKAVKYFESDIASILEFFLDHQTAEGMIFDYFRPLADHRSSRLNVFDRRYWEVLPDDQVQMHRLPVEADVEYLMVEGCYYAWQATSDLDFLERRVPALERAMQYVFQDPLRWSSKFQLVKRGYTIDTWDFLHLYPSRAEYVQRGGVLEDGVFNIDAKTPMGIMHGDNSGMYAACRQLSSMHQALGHREKSRQWQTVAAGIRQRVNDICWNGRFYSHFVECDPPPQGIRHVNQRDSLSLSNPYDINRGLPTEHMSQLIIESYRQLKDSPSVDSFAEWFALYPPIEPHFSDFQPGDYMNGGVNTIVAGELAEAAFQHGYEEYAVDILNRLLDLMKKYHGTLPVAYHPDGSLDSGIPDCWGQAAVVSALIEGLAGVVDRTACFEEIEVSPRWTATDRQDVKVCVAYGPSSSAVTYDFHHSTEDQTIQIRISGDFKHCDLKVLLPGGHDTASVEPADEDTPVRTERIRNSTYVVMADVESGDGPLVIHYR